MKQVSKSVLKARMLEYFREVEKTGEELVVTDNKDPVLKVVPIHTRKGPEEVFSDVRGKVAYRASVLENTLKEWEELF